MSNEKISSLDLISAISEQSGTTKKVATAFIRQFTETVEAALLRDGIVKIKGFGTFKIVWNESRSSINVNTGERYEIAGHNKITFTPDEEVSIIVNRPYAHLESIDMEGNVLTPAMDLPEEDPHMKRFSEQASEIVNLIADMQAFKPKKKAKNEVAEIPLNELKTESLSTLVEPEIPSQEISTEEEILTAEKNTEESAISAAPDVQNEEKQERMPIEEPVVPQEKIPTPASVSEPEPEPIKNTPEEKEEAVPNPVEQPVSESELIERMSTQPEHKSYKWLYISLAIIVILAGMATACYFLWPNLFSGQQAQNHPIAKPAVAVKPAVTVAVIKPDTTGTSKTKSATPHTELKSEVKAKPAPTPAPQPKDIFETPRVYKEFIATETASEGTWLTMLSLKYYGHKLFWVYIYEANKDRLHNPGVLPPGTKIRIPKLDPRLIDKHNGRCFRQASELQTRYTTQQ